MGFFKKLGQKLRKNILNPVKSIMAKTPVGRALNTVLPGALDPNVNIFAAPPPPVIPEPLTLQQQSALGMLPQGAAGSILPPGHVAVPEPVLAALLAAANAAGAPAAIQARPAPSRVRLTPAERAAQRAAGGMPARRAARLGQAAPAAPPLPVTGMWGVY